MRNRRPVFAGVKLFCERVEGKRVIAEVGDVENGFGVGEVEAGEVCVQAGLWAAEVRYSAGGANARAGLGRVSSRDYYRSVGQCGVRGPLQRVGLRESKGWAVRS